jgi:hypothetical protein
VVVDPELSISLDCDICFPPNSFSNRFHAPRSSARISHLASERQIEPDYLRIVFDPDLEPLINREFPFRFAIKEW